jgi:hypothetical protein
VKDGRPAGKRECRKERERESVNFERERGVNFLNFVFFFFQFIRPFPFFTFFVCFLLKQLNKIKKAGHVGGVGWGLDFGVQGSISLS